MRRAVLLLTLMAATVLAASGVALAFDCGAGSCWGTEGDDLMIGTPDSNGLHGLGGDDLIRGSGGNDSLTGDDGDDAVHGGSGDDTVKGNLGNDTVTGSSGDDTVEGGWGNDLVVGGSGKDTLRAGAGADRVEAQDGFADSISCGAGSRDVVFFDQGLDMVAADCEARRP
jgi:Ca2+-binding RTX toxin-like protein